MSDDAGVRLQRVLARAGVASRRHSEELISAGRVTVNGTVAHLGQSVNPARDEIKVDGTVVKPAATAVWLLLNKPAGVMTTRADPQGRRTVFDLVKDAPGLTYVGRLDYMTEGALLLTTDGAAANALTHPSFEVEREYVAVVSGNVEAAVTVARRGIELEDGPVRPINVSGTRVGGGLSEFRLTIAEGRKQEVRRLCKALGLTVERLIRVRYGPVRLGDLPSGMSRPLTQGEHADVRSAMQKGPQPRDDLMEVEVEAPVRRPSRKEGARRQKRREPKGDGRTSPSTERKPRASKPRVFDRKADAERARRPRKRP